MAGGHKGNQNAQFLLIIHDFDIDKVLFPSLSFLIDNTIIAPTCQISIM